MRLSHALAFAVLLGGCDDPKKDGGEASAAVSASAAPAAASAPAGPRPFTVMPDMFVDDSGIGIGPERIDLGKQDGPSKLTEAVGRIPPDSKQMTLRTTQKAAIRDVAAVVTALGKHGAPNILLKMDGGRKDLPGEIIIVPEGRISGADDCSVVATGLEDYSTGGARSPNMIPRPPKNPTPPPIPICDIRGGVEPGWPGMPPNQPSSFMLPTWKNKSPATTRSKKYVSCTARFMFIDCLLFGHIDSPDDSVHADKLKSSLDNFRADPAFRSSPASCSRSSPQMSCAPTLWGRSDSTEW